MNLSTPVTKHNDAAKFHALHTVLRGSLFCCSSLSSFLVSLRRRWGMIRSIISALRFFSSSSSCLHHCLVRAQPPIRMNKLLLLLLLQLMATRAASPPPSANMHASEHTGVHVHISRPDCRRLEEESHRTVLSLLLAPLSLSEKRKGGRGRREERRAYQEKRGGEKESGGGENRRDSSLLSEEKRRIKPKPEV